MIHRLIDWINDRRHASWLRSIAPFPCGCCECGTGGPHYFGLKPQVTRYLYAGAAAGGSPDEFDWSSCAGHHTPDMDAYVIIDYGEDRVVSIAQAERDAQAAIETRRYLLAPPSHECLDDDCLDCPVPIGVCCPHCRAATPVDGGPTGDTCSGCGTATVYRTVRGPTGDEYLEKVPDCGCPADITAGPRRGGAR